MAKRRRRHNPTALSEADYPAHARTPSPFIVTEVCYTLFRPRHADRVFVEISDETRWMRALTAYALVTICGLSQAACKPHVGDVLSVTRRRWERLPWTWREAWIRAVQDACYMRRRDPAWFQREHHHFVEHFEWLYFLIGTTEASTWKASDFRIEPQRLLHSPLDEFYPINVDNPVEIVDWSASIAHLMDEMAASQLSTSNDGAGE